MSRSSGVTVKLSNTKKPASTKVNSRKSVTYDLDAIKGKIKWLATNYANTSTADLKGEPKKTFDEVDGAMGAIKGTQEYGTLMKYSKEVFGERKSVKPGTVLAHFVGCYYGDQKEGNPLCSATCAGSLQPPSNLGWDSCAKNVGIYDNKQGLKITYSAGNSDMDVYLVGTDEFDGFSQEDAERIKNIGTKNVTVKCDSSTLYESTPVEDLCETTLKHKSRRSEYECEESEEECNDWSWGVVAIVILVVLLIIAAVLYSWYYSSSSSVTKTSETYTLDVSNDPVDFALGPRITTA